MEYLVHHGILGQKWGVRRYQNADGTWTDAGKKRYGKELSRMSDKEQIKESISKRIKDSNIDTTALKNARKRWDKAFEDEYAFEESNEYRKASKKAYNDTIDYFKKYDPDYLDTIIKNNNGKKTNLDAFHDFRKMYEGMEDAAWSKARDEYFKKRNIDPKEEERAYKVYTAESKKIVNSIIGKMGDIKMVNLPKTRFGEYEKLDQIVDSALDSLIVNELYRKN